MLVAVKVANAETAIGVFDDCELVASWNVTTRSPSTADELVQVVAPFLGLLITVPLNFVLNKYWAFRKEKKKTKQPEEHNDSGE